tara:strand:+ start:132 stop:659 length:528 start_codon:yes stop_codon:yes gene_type:complete
MYKYVLENVSNSEIIFCSEEKMSIPLDPANRHYQEVLDAIILEGADCFDGDIPTDVQAAADAKKFANQLADYTRATTRLAQYVVSEGRAEVTEDQPTGEQVWDEDTERMVDVTRSVVTVTAIAAVDATVEVTTYDEMGDNPSTATITNPLITTDVAERAAAQTVVDATPQAVKDA